MVRRYARDGSSKEEVFAVSHDKSQARHCASLKWGLQRYIVTLATDYWLGLDERRLFWNAAAHACFMLRVSRIQEVHCLYIIDCTISFSLSTS